jgi:hypothetical protein
VIAIAELIGTGVIGWAWCPAAAYRGRVRYDDMRAYSARVPLLDCLAYVA